MKTIAMTIALLAGLPLAASAQVTKEDIKKLTSAGISDEVILSYVKANGGVAKLSAEDVVELKQAGASEKLLSSVLSASAPESQRVVVEKRVETVPAPATTTYVDSNPYYYTPASAYYSDYYYPRSYTYPSYYYSSSYCYPRSYYYYSSPYYSSYSSCYPRSYYYSPGISIGVSTGRHYSGRGYIGVSGYRR